jgi:hypothetical protein
MTMTLFLGIYALALTGGIAVAVLFMRQRVVRMITAGPLPENATESVATNEVAAFKAIEIAMAAVGQAQSRLVAARDSVLSASVG